MQGVKEQPAQVGRRPTESDPQIGTTDIADKEGVAGEHRVRLRCAFLQIVHQKRNGFGSVAGGFEGFEAHVPEFDGGAVGERRKAVFGLGFGANIDHRTNPVAEFQMAGNEIGMQMG